jgi:hypothetical protein
MGEEKMPTIEEALDEIKTKPLVDIWPTLCVAVGVSKGTGYEAVKRGDFEVLEIGRLKKVLTAPLRRKLGLDEAWRRLGDVAREVCVDVRDVMREKAELNRRREKES